MGRRVPKEEKHRIISCFLRNRPKKDVAFNCLTIRKAIFVKFLWGFLCLYPGIVLN